jgi:hypothetical protein
MSGRHVGHLVGLPDGAGTAFVPDHPFITRESVNVTAVLRSPIAGTASGAPGATRLSFSFRVAAPLKNAAPPSKPASPPPQKHTSAQPARADPTAQHFHSMPGLGPPIVHATADPDHVSGDIFITPSNSRQHGPMILNPRGHLVWFDHITNRLSVYNLEAQTYRGQPVLTWWQGKFAYGHGIDGRGVIMNSSYRILKEVGAGNGYTSDLHEFEVSPQGTAFIDCYVPVPANLTSEGGSSNGTVLDGVIQKIDIRTGRVLWEWHSLGHVPLSASYIGASGASQYDYFHLNSIQELSNGKLIVSARNTWAVYMIDERTGAIDWTLGGKYSSLHVGPGAGFQWQHHAVLHRNGLLTVFDDAAVPQDESASSAKELRINGGTVSLVKRYSHHPPVVALIMGSVQLLANHDVFVGWGDTNYFSEYAPSGRQIFNGSFLGPVNSYRAYRFTWRGQPRTPPAMALSHSAEGAIKVYTAWNGATDVARWRVLGGAAPNALSGLGEARDRGSFETGQWVHAEPRYFAVDALGAQGKVLGRSAAIARPANLAVFGHDAFVSASTGSGTLPVACFTLRTHTCAVKITIASGHTVLGHARDSFTANRGGLLRFRLSSVGRQKLAAAHAHRLSVQLSGQDSSGQAASRRIELIQFTTDGAGPRRSVSGSPTIEILATTDFASRQGQGTILAACHASVSCHVQGSVSAGGMRIATITQSDLGAQELGYVPFQLTPVGQAMLAGAPGNQLAAQVRLTNGRDLAAGQIALVRYR